MATDSDRRVASVQFAVNAARSAIDREGRALSLEQYDEYLETLLNDIECRIRMRTAEKEREARER